MTFDALGQRLRVPLPWAATILAVVTLGVFAGTWLSGSPGWLVVGATLLAALLAGGVLTTTGPVLGTRTRWLVAHVVLGLFVAVVALLVTLLGGAAGALDVSLQTVVVLGSLWGLALALLTAGLADFLGARRLLRRVATLGLALTVVWGLVVAVALGGVVVQLLVEGVDLGLVQDLRDDLLPFLVVSVGLVVLPALVFRRDRREAWARELA